MATDVNEGDIVVNVRTRRQYQFVKFDTRLNQALLRDDLTGDELWVPWSEMVTYYENANPKPVRVSRRDRK